MNTGHLPIHKIGPIRWIHSIEQARGCKAFEGILSEGQVLPEPFLTLALIAKSTIGTSFIGIPRPHLQATKH